MAVDRRRNPPRVIVARPVVALDTNALMLPVEAGVRPFDEIERLLGNTDTVVPRAVVSELDRLIDHGSPKEVAAARVGRQLAEEWCRPIGRKVTAADREIERLARSGALDYVVTNDRALRGQILGACIPVISLRGQAQLEVIRP